MKPTDILMNLGAHLILERPVRKLSLADLSTQLEQSGKQMTDHLAKCPDTPANRNQLSHMIGIERWGQRRLRVALGEPFLQEEYNHYCPSEERSWDELRVEADTTRRTTVELVQNITQANVPDALKIRHNQFGPLSVKAWLRYLDVHASGESKRIK
jgi:hypothetical protein